MLNNIRHKVYAILRASEKYTGTDMVYLAKGGAWLLSGQFIFSLSAFLLAIVFANFLPKETYGVYKYILSITGILAISTLSGMGTAVTQSVARGYEGSFLSALKEKIRWGLLGSLIGLGMAIYYFYKNDNILAFAFIVASIFLPLMDPFGLYASFLNGKKRFDVSTKYIGVSQIVISIFLVTALISTKNVFTILFAYFAGWTLLRFIFLKKTIKNFPPNEKIDATTISYGKHLSLLGVLGILAENLDKILLWHYLGGASLAIYTIAQAPINQISALFKNLLPLSFPKLAVAENENIKKSLPKKMAKLFIVIAISTVSYIILAPFFYKIFFPQYLDSIKYSRLMALVLLFFPQKFIGMTLEAKACKKFLYILQFSSSTLRIILYLVLLPIYGIYGAIAANLIPYLWNALLQFYFLQKI